MDELYINGQKADLTGETIILNYKNNLLGGIGALQSSFSYTIALPKTARNCSIFKMAHIPNIRTINGTKVIGETLQVKYLKDGINILGDAVGYLDRISEDAFEISLSFGFLGKFSKWIEEGKTLNDFDYYGDASALTITYGNELTDYPESIDNLPNIFNPYYNLGVEMDEQAKKQIARLPAVRVPYYIEQIENETKCKFNFPENVAEKLKYLAMPLVSKKRYFSEVSFQYPTILNDNSIRSASTYLDNPIIHKTVSPLTFQNRYPKSITGSFNTDEYTVNARSLNPHSRIAQKSVKMPVIVPNNDIERLNIYGQLFCEFPFEIKGDFETTKETIDGNEVTVLPNKDCTITFHKLKRNDITNTWDAIEDIYEASGFIQELKDNYATATFANTSPFSATLESGYAYGFTLSVQIYHNNNYQYEREYNEINPKYTSDEGVFDGGFSFEPNIKGVGDYDLLPEEDTIYAKGNLPDIAQVDFLQTLCNMFGVFPIINPRPKQDDETGRYIVDFINIETLNANKTVIYRNGMPVNDWTNRLVSTPDRVAIATYNDKYGRRNIMKYKDDEKVKSASSAFFDIDDSRLEAEKVLIDLKIAPADDDTIPMYTVEYDKDDSGKRTYTLEDVIPRIMNITPVDVDDVAKAGITFSGLSFDDLKRVYYNSYIKVIQGWRVLTVRVILDTLALANLDYTLPVYLKQFSQWFGVVSVQADSDGNTCNVELLLL